MNAAFFLVGTNVKPCFVDPKEVVYIGRALENTIVLQSPYVSRKHASIRCQNDQFLLSDLQSTNGTFVNTEKITQKLLDVGDKIRVGSFILNFLDRKTLLDRYGHWAEIATLDEAVTTEINRVKNALSDLSGKLSYLNPIELIQMINLGKKTGVLSIVGDNGGEGTIKVNNGEIYSAAHTHSGKNLQGEHAVYRILTIKEGSFIFKFKDPENLSTHEMIPMSTMNLLMEGCRLMDEGQI
ncbi:DUF4388 domain-containing protein [bacterium]|nr:DUF4388 domain-containing protein [bacterium]